MKEITILSGKGGTGKTSIAAAFASLAANSVFCDNDVDAADLHLILQPEIMQEHAFESGDKAIIDEEKCSGCGLCLEYCRFGAINIINSSSPSINPFYCEGCRLCERICPAQAIHTVHMQNNRWFVSETRYGPLIHARMGAGEENSGKLVTRLREMANSIAATRSAELLISDGPPGIGCSVIASLAGTGVVLLVTEPSLSGLHDAIRLTELVHSFNLPLFVLINKYDLNKNVAAQIEQSFMEKNIEVIGKIPFDKRLVKAMVKGKSIIEYAPGSIASKSIRSAWERLIHCMDPSPA